MALAEIGARLRLQGADSFRRDAERAAGGVRGIGDQVDRTERRLRGMSGAAHRAGRALSGIGKGAALGGIGAVTVGVGALAAGLFQGFKDAAALETMMAKTNAVIKSTNGAARVSAKGVLNLADELESLSGIDGDAIINAQNLLLTFTQVKNGTGELNHVFDEATKTAVDMAAALGSDPSAAAMQLGKALNDPIKGVSALSKVGVSFTEKQKKTIKTLVDSGKVMDAQKIILKELSTEFGGAAKAAGSGFEGSMARAKDAIGDMFRDTATPLLPGVTRKIEEFSAFVNETATPAILAFIKGFQDETGAGGRFRDDLRDIWSEAKELGAYAKIAYEKAKGLVDWMRDHEDTVKAFAVAVVAVKVGMAGLAAVNFAAAALGIGAVGTAAGTSTAALIGPAGLVAAITGPAGVIAALAALEGYGLWHALHPEAQEIANVLNGTKTATTGSGPGNGGFLLDGRWRPGQGTAESETARDGAAAARAGVGRARPPVRSIDRPGVPASVVKKPPGSVVTVPSDYAAKSVGGDLHVSLITNDGVLAKGVVRNFRDQSARR